MNGTAGRVSVVLARKADQAAMRRMFAGRRAAGLRARHARRLAPLHTTEGTGEAVMARRLNDQQEVERLEELARMARSAANQEKSNDGGMSEANHFRLAAECLDRAIPHLRKLPQRQAHLHALRARQALVELEIADAERDGPS